jgi:SAM-dependent methyltransferase
MVIWEGDAFTLNGIQYLCSTIGGFVASKPGSFCLLKSRSAVEGYERLLAELKPRTILEIGTWQGGSLAFLTDLAEPRRAVGVDLSPKPSAALIDFISRRSLTDVLHVYTEVDQCDLERLNEIVSTEFDDPLDLVIDDASHRLDPTRTTFSILFPWLRRGGKYVVEDWSWAHTPLPVLVEETPLSVLSLELVLAAASWPDAIAALDVNNDWTIVTRGHAALPSPFDFRIGIDERGRRLLQRANEDGNAQADVTMSGVPFDEFEAAWLEDGELVERACNSTLDSFLEVFARTFVSTLLAYAASHETAVVGRLVDDDDLCGTITALYGARVYRRAMASMSHSNSP